jgi:hypothetical protein
MTPEERRLSKLASNRKYRATSQGKATVKAGDQRRWREKKEARRLEGEREWWEKNMDMMEGQGQGKKTQKQDRGPRKILPKIP